MADDPAGDMVLWYRQPAKQWVEALPVGNGRLGAMVFGGIKDERLQLNEDSLWSGGPQDSDNPEALAALPEIRRLLFEGKYAEANALTNKKLKCKGPGSGGARYGSYQTLGDLTLKFDGPGRGRRISPPVGPRFGRCSSLLSAGRCNLYPRSFFQRGRSGIGCAPKLRQAGQNQFHGHSYPARTIHYPARRPGRPGNERSIKRRPRRRLGNEVRCPGCRRYAKGGSSASTTIHCASRGPTRAILLLAAGTDYKLKPPDYRGDPPEPKTAAQLAAAAAKPYADLLKAHLADYQKLFRRVESRFGPLRCRRLAHRRTS